MKNRVTVLSALFFLLALCAPSLGAQERLPLMFGEQPGFYAVYRDTRFGTTTYIGLCALGENELAIRMYEPSTGAELLVTETFFYSGTPGEPASFVLEGGPVKYVRGRAGERESTDRLLPIVHALLGVWLRSRGMLDEVPEYTFEENGRYSFEFWIPVVQLRGVSFPGTDGAVTLATAGAAMSGIDPSFFNYRGEPEIVSGPAAPIEPGESLAVTADGIDLALDTNWTEGEDGVWRIDRGNRTEAALAVETVDMAELGGADPFSLMRLYLLYPDGVLLPDPVDIFLVDGNPCLFYRVYDPGTREASVRYRIFILRGGTYLSVLSLSVFESAFRANRGYFESLFF